MKSSLSFSGMILVLSCCLNISCKKDEGKLTGAIITGWDQRACVCCGGLMINFSGEAEPYKGDFKLVENSSTLGIKTNDSFPIYVKVAWTTDPNICTGNYIIVDRLIRK